MLKKTQQGNAKKQKRISRKSNSMKNIILLSHCLLNPLSQVRAENERESMEPLLTWLTKNKIGIIQLACPETEVYGLRRWGHVREQFDNINYRKTCRSMINQKLDEVREYINNGCRLLAVVGIDGSPSCGINFSCSSEDWGGEISSIKDFTKIKNINYPHIPGIYMEELKKIFFENSIRTNFIAYNSMDRVSALVKNLESILEKD